MSLNDEQLEIRGLARDFSDQEIEKRSVAWDERGGVDDDVLGKLAELGFLGILVDPDHGGLGMDVPTFALIVEELARGDASLALLVAFHNAPVATLVAASLSEAVRTSWLPRLASGEVRGAVASWGWDLRTAGVDLPAAREAGDGWSVTGRISAFGAVGADVVVVPVATPGGDEAWVLVESGTSGVSVEAGAVPMGLRAAGVATVLLDGAEVASSHVLGTTDSAPVRAALDLGRVAIAATAVGVAARSVEHAAAYAVEREQFGRAIVRFGAIRGKLGEMSRRTEAARALTRSAAERLDSGSAALDASPSATAAMARITAADAVVWVTDEAVQIHGGYGYMKDYPVEKLMRDAQGMQVLGGVREGLHERVVEPLLVEVDPSTMTTSSAG